MGKMFGLVMLITALWVGMEVYQQGADGAFGGAFAALGDSDGDGAPHDGRSIPRRAGDKAQAAHDEAAARRARLLGE
jgi:hypothetical protein